MENKEEQVGRSIFGCNRTFYTRNLQGSKPGKYFKVLAKRYFKNVAKELNIHYSNKPNEFGI